MIVLSGLHSGTNPSPGLGTARSLATAWPGARLEALDYSAGATGLYSDLFSARHVLPRWEEADLNEVVATIASLTENRTAVFVSGLDLESELLAGANLAANRVLVPPAGAFLAARKPAAQIAQSMGLRVPDSLVTASLRQACEFAEQYGWNVWVKGARYEARQVSSLPQMTAAIDYTRETWANSDVIVQAHVDGLEESIAFAALAGRLLGCCHMRKTIVTPEGKTWGGRISAVPSSWQHKLAGLVAEVGWTGGGEIEMVRARTDGELHLIDVNPRFPAWIHGATLAGCNLPAALVRAAMRLDGHEQAGVMDGQFVRIVAEVPVGQGPLSPPAPVLGSGPGVPAPSRKGHPSGMPQLAKRLAALAGHGAADRGWEGSLVPSADPRAAALDAACQDLAQLQTPVRLLLPSVLAARLGELEAIAARLRRATGVQLRIAYSVKTNPDPLILAHIREAGHMAEAISGAEVARCLDVGFPDSEIVLNGPGKWWRMSGIAGQLKLAAIFCDSYEDLERSVSLIGEGAVATRTLGIRVAPLGYRSRFGVDLSSPSEFVRLARSLTELSLPCQLGVHFHLAASQVGAPAWAEEVAQALILAAALAESAGKEISVLDLGGGWPPAALPAYAEPALLAAIQHAMSVLPAVRLVVVEPGKLLAGPAGVVLSRVLEVQKSANGAAVVVDASVAELPDWISQPHPMLWRAATPGSGWYGLPEGEDRVLGRLCMEHDLPGFPVSLPPAVTAGDLIAFGGAGAYDASMSYSFGMG